MHYIPPFVTASVLVLAAGFATAAPQDTTLRMSFSSVDANGDGAIVKAELAAVVQTGFQRLDPNGDGVLDPRELHDIAAARAADKGGDPQKLLGRVMRAKDKNDDGRLTPLELNPAAVRSVFQALDRNGDGKITLAEWNAAAGGGSTGTGGGGGNSGNGAGNTNAGNSGGTGVSKGNPQTGQTGTPGNESAPGTPGVGSPTLDNPQALGGADGDTTTRDMQTGDSNGLTGMLEGGKVVIEFDTVFGARR